MSLEMFLPASSAIILSFLLFASFIYFLNQKINACDGTKKKCQHHQRIAFVTLLDNEPLHWHAKVLAEYKREMQQLLEQMSRALLVSQDDYLESVWLERIQILSALLEHNLHVLDNVFLQPFVAKRLLSDRTFEGPITNANATSLNKTKSSLPVPVLKASIPDNHNAYDSALQVLAHIVRDWTADGKEVRSSLYDWCIHKLLGLKETRALRRILVPGAGLGRLAYELAVSTSAVVDCVEASWSMAAAAASILSMLTATTTRNTSIYAYASDFLNNEVDFSQRYRELIVPDRGASGGTVSLTYMIGDFNSLRQKESQATYDAVVTCYFIDTATNVLDYIDIIESLLVITGVWINVGPLHWHQNSVLPLTASDVQQILIRRGWKIVEWRMQNQKEPVHYRSTREQSTHLQAHFPLRFVAIRETGSSTAEHDQQN